MSRKSILASLIILLTSVCLFSLNPVNAQPTTIEPDATPILCPTFYVKNVYLFSGNYPSSNRLYSETSNGCNYSGLLSPNSSSVQRYNNGLIALYSGRLYRTTTLSIEN